jgi:hypothetical protein
MKARGYSAIQIDLFDDSGNIQIFRYEWEKMSNNTKYLIKISPDIFDDENKLKFYKRTDWNDNYVILETISYSLEKDDLPF